ncbi:glycoside hydrolase family 13 protein [Nocardioides pocheonensis]|uniref:Alpha-glucosidase n=1 Tax=Nocardioides pocheonensis TaxID=661485 RepID=A0A3N0GIZ2_9ACTN|nr:glycoside hydrolase family 13 protein [Nocardioides pocheonensis]RNM12437.1 alpha-glucosidase [Nocardioides pocheonensis]
MSDDAQAAPWWRSAVVYQLYLKSFLDTDGDGIGDLDGVLERLDHIAGLGVDGVWFNPCYPSPQRDGGYDVADYLTIDPVYGGLPAFERFLEAAHARGLKVLLDLVPNHCSDQHPWFQEALAAEPGSAARRRFIFADGRGPDGSEPPNNWRSMFGGPAWARVPDGQWYLHLFDATQPDFNWDDPSVPAMFDDVLATWFERGVDGFRIDVAHGMVKERGLPDVAPGELNRHAWNQPGIHDIFRRWRRVADSYDRDLTLVGEAWVSPAHSAEYIRADELHQVFYFGLIREPFEAAAFRHSVESAYAVLSDEHGAPTWTLNNHDVHRAVTRYGIVEPEPITSPDANALLTRIRGRVDLELGTQRALAALLFLLALPGSVYLYQGEELGLPEVQDLPDEARQDPMWERTGHTDFGRDGCRVPLPWTEDGPTFGFTSGTPWLPQPEWFADYAASREERDPGSVLHLYRAALRTRRQIDQGTPLAWVDAGRADVLAFRRGDVVCVTVFDGAPYAVPNDWGDLVLGSGPAVQGTTVPAGHTGWFRG